MAGGRWVFRGLPFHPPFEKPVHNELGIFLVFHRKLVLTFHVNHQVT